MAINAEGRVGIGGELNPEAIQEELVEAFGENYRGIVMLDLVAAAVPLSEEEVFSNPPHLHSGSRAIYLADFLWRTPEGRLDRWLISYIRPGVETSEHLHPPGVREHYVVLAGRCNQKINGRVTSLVDERVVEPGEIHQVQGTEGPALLRIVMEGIDSIPEDQQHISVTAISGNFLNPHFGSME